MIRKDKVMVSVQDVSMGYQMDMEHVSGIKEWVINRLTGKKTPKGNMFWALDGVNLQVTQGEVVGIIGRNGSGKSTLLKTISGILPPTRGEVRTNGRIVPMLELGSGFDIELTGRENIFLNGAILGYTEKFLKDRYEEILAFSELGNFIDAPIKTYSSGMMMRLAFSIATVVEPEILIVDEILAVGDETFQEKSRARMMELMGGGTTVLYVSHSLMQIRELCTKVLWLDHGQTRMLGPAQEVCDCYHLE